MNISDLVGAVEALPRSPEERLWLAVLIRALQDAGGDGGAHELLPARVWLLNEGDAWWVREVCAMAGVDAELVLQWTRRVCREEPPHQLFPGVDFTRRVSEKNRGRPRPAGKGRLAAIPRQGRRAGA